MRVMNNRSETALGIVLTSLLTKNIFFAADAFVSYKRYINAFVTLIVLVMFFWRSKVLFKRHGYALLLTCYLSIIYTLGQLLLFPSNADYFLADIPRIVLYGVLPFLIAITVEDYDYLMIVLRRSGYMIVGASIMTVAVIYHEGGLQAEYSMSFGNSVVVGAVILEHYALKDRKWYDIVLFASSILCILVGGSRGPFLGVIAYYILYICFISESNTLKSRFKNSFIVLLGLSLFLFYDTILENLYYFFSRFGIRSRALLLFMSGNIGQDSGRSGVYKLCFELLSKNPIKGTGYDGLKGLGYADLTPHNTYLEFLLYNGIFIGGILIIVLVSVWLIGMVKNRRTSIHYLCVIFFSLYVPRSFIGAGGIEKIDFWMLLAFSIMSIEVFRYQRHKEENLSDIQSLT